MEVEQDNQEKQSKKTDWGYKEEKEFTIKNEPDWDNISNFKNEFEIASQNIKVENEEYNVVEIEQEKQLENIRQTDFLSDKADFYNGYTIARSGFFQSDQNNLLSFYYKTNDAFISEENLQNSNFTANAFEAKDDKGMQEKQIIIKKEPSWDNEDYVQNEPDWNNDINVKHEFEIVNQNIKTEYDDYNVVTIEQDSQLQNDKEFMNDRTYSSDDYHSNANLFFVPNQDNTHFLNKENQAQTNLQTSESIENIFAVKTEENKDIPGMRCTVAVCNNSYMKSRTSDPKLMFHKFPKNPTIRQIRLQHCPSDSKWNPDTLRVSSAHFNANDFVRDLKSKFLGHENKHVLKKIAVPSLNLSEDSTEIENYRNDERASQFQHHQNKETVAKIPEKIETFCPIVNDEKEEVSSSVNVEKNISAEDSISSQNEIGENLNVLLLQKRMQILEKDYNLLKMKSLKTERQLKATQQKLDIEKIVTCSLKHELKCLKRSEIPKAMIEKKAIEILKLFLTENQIDIFLKKKKITKWSKDEIVVALTLRYLSKRAYIYLRRELNFPLPGLPTLQQLASKFYLGHGILQDVLEIMKVASYKYTLCERLTVIQFDEMEVKYTYEYDFNTDQIIGPHSQMQVAMVRGLTSAWKQPIYVNFDSKMTKEILLSIIINLEDTGYPVVACVCNMSGRNLSLWREMGINRNRPWIVNPRNSLRKVYFFADAPHLLKLIRNWLLDSGFEINGTAITKDPIVQLITSNNSELKIDHVSCHGIQRQNITLATELLSHSTAVALKHYKPINEELALDTAKFVELVSTWFDIMNSYTHQTSIPEKCAYGEHLEEQNKVLQMMMISVTNLRCVGKKNMQIFQKGIIISIKCLQMLYQDLASYYGVKSILTHRLNQDSMENLFLQIRTRDRLNDHPTPLNALYRIRLIILGKNHGSVCQSSNTSSWSEDQYLIPKVLTATGVNPQIECPKVLLAENQDNLCDSNILETSDVNNCSNELQTPLSEMEENGLSYVGGWIARELHYKYPHLGIPIKKTSSDHDYINSSWIQYLSHKNIYEPTSEFREQLEQMEIIFSSSDVFLTLSKQTGLLEKMSTHIAKALPNIPKDVINTFTRIRTFIRLKYLNKQIVAKQTPCRKNSLSSGSQTSKKIKKNYR